MKRTALALAIALVAGGAWSPGWAASSPRLMLLSCDGAGSVLVRQMIEAGVMPHLAALAREGTQADHARTNFASKTAAGHAALWTGTFGNRNGVSSNLVPRQPLKAHTILETQSGFTADTLVAEPLFVTAARAGKRVVTLNLTQSSPLAVYAPGGAFGAGVGDRLTIFDGFAGSAGDDGLWGGADGVRDPAGWRDLPTQGGVPPLEIRKQIGTTTFFGLLFDDVADPALGYDTCWITRERSGQAPLAVLKPRAGDPGWSPRIAVDTAQGPAFIYFRLFELAQDAGRFSLYHTAPTRPATNRPVWLADYEQAGGGFIEGGAGRVYFQGGFGLTIAEGGSGGAEARYLETLRFAVARLRPGMQHLVSSRPWELFMHYLQLPDQAEHFWYGYITPGNPAYDAGLARKLMPALRTVYGELDAYIGAVRRALPRDAALMLVSDHGMAPARWDFLPNVALRQAGLLTLDAEGQVDLARTQAMYAVMDGAYVVVNTTEHKQGIVPPRDVPRVLAQVKSVLGGLRVKTPEGLVPLVTAMVEPTPALAGELGIGGRFGGHLYLDLQPGYYFSPSARGDQLYRDRPPNASGAHVFDSRRPELYAMFYAAGPGIKRGAAIGGIRNIDVAPTVSRYLGIKPPAQATGRVLTEILVHP